MANTSSPEDYDVYYYPITEKKKGQKKTSTTVSVVTKSNPTFLMSVTGFTDSSRYGIISMLNNNIGAGYTDHLSRKNTHLICKDVGGQKYTKAVEWSMYVVSVEWLSHNIVRYGYRKGWNINFYSHRLVIMMLQ